MARPTTAELAERYKSFSYHWPDGMSALEDVASDDLRAKLAAAKAELKRHYPDDSIPPIFVINEMPDWRELMHDIARIPPRDRDEAIQQVAAARYLFRHYNLGFNRIVKYPNGKSGAAIIIGSEVMKHLTAEELLAVIHHEYGHKYEEAYATVVFKRLDPTLTSDEKFNQFFQINECRADRFVPPELRPHFVSAMRKILAMEFDPDVMKSYRLIHDRAGLPSDHPLPEDRIRNLLAAKEAPGLSGMHGVRFNPDCSEYVPPRPKAVEESRAR